MSTSGRLFFQESVNLLQVLKIAHHLDPDLELVQPFGMLRGQAGPGFELFGEFLLGGGGGEFEGVVGYHGWLVKGVRLGPVVPIRVRRFMRSASSYLARSTRIEPPKVERNRFIAFLRRHGQTVSFVGLSIVLATFVVKEVWRDNAKDLLSALQSAESTFTVRSEFTALRAQLNQLATDVQMVAADRHLENYAGIRSGIAFYNGVLSGLFSSTHSTMDNMSISLRSFSRLIDELPAGRKRRMEKLRDSCTDLLARYQKMEERIEKEWNKELNAINATSWDEREKKSAELDKAYSAATITSLYNIHLWSELMKFEGKLIDEAKAASEERKRQYELYVSISYWLFAFGWLLALVGTSLRGGRDATAES
jgi:hypothetical protein